MRIAILSLLLFSGCSGVQVKQRADGTYTLECSSRKACLDRAERTCGQEGYTIVGGQSNKKLYGVPGNAKLVGKDEIYVRCNKDRPADTPDPAVGSWRLEKPEGDAQPATSAPSPGAEGVSVKTPAAPVCRPGETQRCVGAGACEGGQACLPDGGGFGPCDCGASTASSATEAEGPNPTHP